MQDPQQNLEVSITVLNLVSNKELEGVVIEQKSHATLMATQNGKNMDD